MNGLFTVFGLGIACGIFLSWLYDVVRKRNQPVSRGASFEAFHGDNVMPAPEPVSLARPSEPVLHTGREPAKRVVALDPVLSEAKTPPLEPLNAPTSATLVVAPVVHAPVVKILAPRKETVLLDPTVAENIELLDGVPPNTPVQLTEVVEAQLPELAVEVVDVNFDVGHTDFQDTLSFEATDSVLPELPTEPHVPRVVLLVNNTLVREVQENDLPGLMSEFGIASDSEQATLFQGGNPVTIGRTSVQLAQV